MFRFLELELNGWDLWPPFKVPLDADIVVISGQNGSGKTTLLDAIRQLLNAPRLSQQRRVAHYLKVPNQPALLRAVVSNRPDERGRRPFERQGVFSDQATLACALRPMGGTPEKRYVILDGSVQAQELQELLLGGRDWLGPEEYGRALDYAGVSRSLLHTLALEQGRADELSRRRPRELFMSVMDARGAQDVLERYKGARNRFEESDQELARQREQVQRVEVDLTEVERSVRRLDEHFRLRRRIEDAEAIAVAARLQRLLKDLQDSGSEQERLQADSANLVTAVERLARELDEDDAHLSRLKEQSDAEQEHLQAAEDALEETVRKVARLEQRVNDAKEAARELAQLVAEDRGALEEAIEEKRRDVFSLEQQLNLVNSDLTEVEEQIADLHRGIPRYPEDVERTLSELKRLSIQFTLAATTLELADESWAPAIESALGQLRFALGVLPQDESRVALIAQSLGFPGPIVSELTEKGLATDMFEIKDNAPSWLVSWAETTQFTENPRIDHSEEFVDRSGLRRNAFGIWVSTEQDRVLGGQAVKLQLAAAEEKLANLRESSENLAQLKSEASGNLSALIARLAAEDRRAELLRQTERLPGLEIYLNAARGSVADLRSNRDTAAARRNEVIRSRDRIKFQMEQKGSTLTAKKHDLDTAKTKLGELGTGRAEIEADIRKTEANQSTDLKEQARTGVLPSESMADRDATAARDELDNFLARGPLPDETVREQQRLLSRNLEELQGHVRDRQNEADSARDELEQCRGDYLEVIRNTLYDYSRRARSLAELASASLQADLPTLENDDRSIDEAGILVRIGFDGKSPTAIGDSAHSGGQQVIAGLVLLMAMAETDGDNFFMIDEPFAHLSLDRVDDVGRFLRSSGSQFLVTVPTTLDRGQLDPASLLIVLKKKDSTERYASRPLVARV